MTSTSSTLSSGTTTFASGKLAWAGRVYKEIRDENVTFGHWDGKQFLPKSPQNWPEFRAAMKEKRIGCGDTADLIFSAKADDEKQYFGKLELGGGRIRLASPSFESIYIRLRSASILDINKCSTRQGLDLSPACLALYLAFCVTPPVGKQIYIGMQPIEVLGIPYIMCIGNQRDGRPWVHCHNARIPLDNGETIVYIIAD